MFEVWSESMFTMSKHFEDSFTTREAAESFIANEKLKPGIYGWWFTIEQINK